MKLVTLGDSFTYGEELEDRNLSWPQLLADKLGYTLENLGVPGSGNTRILRTAIEFADNADLVIVAWSHFARIEMADENGVYSIWPGNAGHLFKGAMSFRSELLDYINRHHDDLYMFTQSLINIILLQKYLNSIGKKYIMLDSFNENYDPTLPRTKLKESAPNLLEKIDSRYYIGWPNETMMEWTYGCPKGPGGHFLEQGHEIVADKIYEHIRHLSWIP